MTRVALTAVVASVAIAVSACGGTTSDDDERPGSNSPPPTFVTPTETTARITPHLPSTPLSAPETLPPSLGVDEQDPDSVARAVVTIWWSWDTTADLGPDDAQLRAVPLLDDRLATQLRNFPRISGPGADWLDLTARGAVATVSDVRIASEPTPPDTATEAARLYEVTQTISTANGSLPTRNFVAAVTLTKSPEGWRATRVVQR